MGNVVPLHRQKQPPPVLPEGRGATRQGQRLKTGPYTTKALPANITNLVLPLGGVSGGLFVYVKGLQSNQTHGDVRQNHPREV